MKKITFIISALVLLACNSNKEIVNQKASEEVVVDVKNSEIKSVEKSTVKSEKINLTVPDEEDKVILLGKANREGFQQEPFNNWFTTNYNGHTPDFVLVEKTKPLLKDVTIETFMGTWCSDSQRDVPALFKILDAADFNFAKMELVAVSRDKITPQGFEAGKNIQQVPTIIFYKNEKEIGRFVEYAIETLEKDMYAILSGANYKHAYED